MNNLKRLGLTLVCVGLLIGIFAVNPVASQGQRGPRIDTQRRKVTRSPAAQRAEMTIGPPVGSEIWQGLIRPSDIEAMADQGKPIHSRGGFHFCFIGFNYRRHPLDDVNYRHALFHLLPKDRIIGNLFKYINVKIDTPAPPAQSRWYNSKVDAHPYSPSEAEAILVAGGYQKIGGVWKDTDGSDLPDLEFYIPLEIVAPTSFTIGKILDEEAEAIGLTNLVPAPKDFSTYVDLVFNQQDFDMFWFCHSLSRFPTHLYWMLHSRNDFLGGDNCYGVNWPKLDALLDILYFSLDHAAKVAACQEAQEMIMGGTLSAPLPTYVPPGDPRRMALALIPVYSRNCYDVRNSQLKHTINMFGYATDNSWTEMTIFWDTPNEYRPGTTERTVVWVEEEYPERLNPLLASTMYAHDYLDPTFDGLIAVNPYVYADEPWLATSWSYVAVPEGMDITFNLRITDLHGAAVTWQSGAAISVNDVKFAYDFLYDWQIPKYWGAIRYYDPANTVIVDSDTIKVRITATSQWLLYTFAGVAYILPPPVWTNNPTTGNPWTSTAEILGFDPSAHAGPGGLPTMLYGTGPFILQHSTTFIGVNGYGDLAANRNYWLTTQDFQDKLQYMFWRAGDVNKNGKVESVGDLDEIGLAWNTSPPSNPDADICGPGGDPPDDEVDVYDFSQCSKMAGETLYDEGGGPPQPTDKPPTCSIVDPVDGQVLTEVYYVKVDAVDDNEVSTVELSIDSGSWIDITNNFDGTYYYYDWDTTAESDGSHTLDARATDNANQVAYASQVTVMVGTMHVENIEFKPKDLQKLDIIVTIYDDAGIPVTGATVYVNITYPDGSVYPVSELTNKKGVATFEISKPTQGTYTITVTNVTHDLLTYYPAANKETTDSHTIT